MTCAVCRQPLALTPAQAARGVRFHAGRCAAAARGFLWSEDRLRRHMAMMQRAAAQARRAKFYARLRRLAPLVRAVDARLLYEAGYQAGWQAGRRRRRGRVAA